MPWFVEEPGTGLGPAELLAASRFDGDYEEAMRWVERMARKAVRAGVSPEEAAWPLTVLEAVVEAREAGAAAAAAAAASAVSPGAPGELTDADVCEWLATESGFGVTARWAAGIGWLRYDGRRWKPTPEPVIFSEVKQRIQDMIAEEVKAGAGSARVAALGRLLSRGRIEGQVRLVRGQVADSTLDYDVRPDLLNVANGTLGLRTGELQEHDPEYKLIKITEVDYVPGAVHEVRTRALTALPEEVAAYLQVRVGQSATRYPPDDDVVCFLHGGAENGKSTLLSGIQVAIGEHCSHSTELMDFKGTRLAVHEELPDGHHLDMKKIKERGRAVAVPGVVVVAGDRRGPRNRCGHRASGARRERTDRACGWGRRGGGAADPRP